MMAARVQSMISDKEETKHEEGKFEAIGCESSSEVSELTFEHVFNSPELKATMATSEASAKKCMEILEYKTMCSKIWNVAEEVALYVVNQNAQVARGLAEQAFQRRLAAEQEAKLSEGTRLAHEEAASEAEKMALYAQMKKEKIFQRRVQAEDRLSTELRVLLDANVEANTSILQLEHHISKQKMIAHKQALRNMKLQKALAATTLNCDQAQKEQERLQDELRLAAKTYMETLQRSARTQKTFDDVKERLKMVRDVQVANEHKMTKLRHRFNEESKSLESLVLQWEEEIEFVEAEQNEAINAIAEARKLTERAKQRAVQANAYQMELEKKRLKWEEIAAAAELECENEAEALHEAHLAAKATFQKLEDLQNTRTLIDKNTTAVETVCYTEQKTIEECQSVEVAATVFTQDTESMTSCEKPEAGESDSKSTRSMLDIAIF